MPSRYVPWPEELLSTSPLGLITPIISRKLKSLSLRKPSLRLFASGIMDLTASLYSDLVFKSYWLFSSFRKLPISVLELSLKYLSAPTSRIFRMASTCLLFLPSFSAIFNILSRALSRLPYFFFARSITIW